MCTENLMLLLSIVPHTELIGIALIIYELYKNSQGISSPSLDSVAGTYSKSDLLLTNMAAGAH